MRRPRVIVSGSRYHVVARANRKEFILESPEMKNLLLRVIGEARQRFRFTIDTMCIMSNHVHLLIWPHKGESLSRIMQWMLSVFAMRFNRRLHLVGHVWYDRFRSSIIHNITQFSRVYRYIGENPARAGMVVGDSAYLFGAREIRRRNLNGALGPPSLLSRLLFPEGCTEYQITRD